MDRDNTINTLVILPLVMTFLTQLLSKLDKFNINEVIHFFKNIYWKDLYHKPSMIVLSGERLRNICEYSGEASVTEVFTPTFRAFWDFMLTNTEISNKLYEVTELITSNNKSVNRSKMNKDNEEVCYFVSQPTMFLINKEFEIYGKTYMRSEVHEKKRTSSLSSSQHICIEIFSYKLSVCKLKDFLHKITDNFLKKVQTEREKSRFIYFISEVDEEDYYHNWVEEKFECTRSFNNFFFDGKEDFMNRLNFFLNNKQWYYDKGIPYSLGIALYGPPGTGKTSLIKSIAKYTNRHLINLSMKLFKNRRQLYRFFYESRYNLENKEDSIGFDKKIILIEDIDCLGDIVLKREFKKDKKGPKIEVNNVEMKNDFDSGDDKKTYKLQPTDPITLDDILNIWDGIIETPGRILIITTNHYEKLDPALIRPGRIDIALEMNKLSGNNIMKVFEHLYEKPFPKKYKRIIEKKQLTPAEIMNLFKNNCYDSTGFLYEMTK